MGENLTWRELLSKLNQLEPSQLDMSVDVYIEDLDEHYGDIKLNVVVEGNDKVEAALSNNLRL